MKVNINSNTFPILRAVAKGIVTRKQLRELSEGELLELVNNAESSRKQFDVYMDLGDRVLFNGRELTAEETNEYRTRRAGGKTVDVRFNSDQEETYNVTLNLNPT